MSEGMTDWMSYWLIYVECGETCRTVGVQHLTSRGGWGVYYRQKNDKMRKNMKDSQHLRSRKTWSFKQFKIQIDYNTYIRMSSSEVTSKIGLGIRRSTEIRGKGKGKGGSGRNWDVTYVPPRALVRVLLRMTWWGNLPSAGKRGKDIGGCKIRGQQNY